MPFLPSIKIKPSNDVQGPDKKLGPFPVSKRKNQFLSPVASSQSGSILPKVGASHQETEEGEVGHNHRTIHQGRSYAQDRKMASLQRDLLEIIAKSSDQIISGEGSKQDPIDMLYTSDRSTNQAEAGVSHLPIITESGVSWLHQALAPYLMKAAMKGSIKDYRLEDMSANAMKKLEYAFKVAEEKDGPLKFDTFKTVIQAVAGHMIPEKELKIMFMKIDTNCDDTVSWSEYVSFLLCELQKQDAMKSTKNDNILPEEISTIIDYKHHNFISRIRYCPTLLHRGTKHERWDYAAGRYVSLSIDGMVCFWKPTMECTRSHHLETTRTVPLYCTDFVVMTNVNYVAIATSKNDLQFYELGGHSRFDNVLTITSMRHMVLSMDYWMEVKDLNKARLIWGDTGGNIYILTFWKCMNGGLFGNELTQKRTTLKQFAYDIKLGYKNRCHMQKLKRLHLDWVRSLRYVPELDSIVSSCCEETTALAITSTSELKTKYFSVVKGVIAFDYSIKQNILVSGGVEQNIRGWNPFINTGPIFHLKGSSAVLHLMVNQDRDLCISIGLDKNVSIFSLKDQTLVQTIPARAFPKQYGHKPLTAALFNNYSQVLVVGSTELSVFVPDLEKEIMMKSYTHESSLCSVLYNSLYEVLVTASNGSTVCVWDIKTGEKKLMFDKAHTAIIYNKESVVDLTAMEFDHTMRRLITGGRDGSVKIWNFHNGDCLRVMQTEGNMEVTSIISLKYKIIAAGLNRKITVFMDVEGSEAVAKVWDKKTHEDIQAMVYHFPNTLITASYDGDILVWSTETCQPACRLNHTQSTLPMMGTEAPVKAESQKGLIAKKFSAPVTRALYSTGQSETTKFKDLLQVDPDFSGRISSASTLNNPKASEAVPTIQLQVPEVNDLERVMKNESSAKPTAVNEPMCSESNKELSKDDATKSNISVLRCKVCNGVKTNTLLVKAQSAKDVHTCSCNSDAESRCASTSRLSISLELKRSTSHKGRSQNQSLTCVECMVALQERKVDRKTASIFAGGADGWVRAWSIHYGGGLLGQFMASQRAQDAVTSLAVDKRNLYLFTGDAYGYIKVWFIGDYCVKTPYTSSISEEEREKLFSDRLQRFQYFSYKKLINMYEKHRGLTREQMMSSLPAASDPENTVKKPLLLTSFRGHTKSVTCITYSENYDLIISGAEDYNVRVWSVGGRYIGQLGTDTWPRIDESNIDWQFDDKIEPKLPPDVRRVASPRSLRTWHGGVSKKWKLVKNGIMLLVGPWFKLSMKPTSTYKEAGLKEAQRKAQSSAFPTMKYMDSSGLSDDESDVNLAYRKISESLAVPKSNYNFESGKSKILGKSYHKTTCHREAPDVKSFYRISDSLMVWPKVMLTETQEIKGEEFSRPEVLVEREKRRCKYISQIVQDREASTKKELTKSVKFQKEPSADDLIPRSRLITVTAPCTSPLTDSDKIPVKTPSVGKHDQKKGSRAKTKHAEAENITIDKLSLEIAELLGEFDT